MSDLSDKGRSRSMSLVVLDKVSHPGKSFCQYCAGSFFFWALVAMLAIAEPVICSRHTTIGSQNHQLQVIILAASSVLYFIQLIGVATREWEKIVMIEALTSLSSLPVPKKGDFSFLKMLIFFTAEGEYILEFICLVGGWSVIFLWPGIAVLRCFRVFRLLWFYEVEVFKSSVENTMGPIIGRTFVSRGFKVLKFAIKSLTALGNELFRLTNETRGALLLIMMLVYSAFVIGTALWIETDRVSELCGSIGECTYTLMRLTFFDGDGFDFAFFLTKSHRIMFMVVMVYMCLTSFGILNGLVGIFGTAIANASELAFNGDDNIADDTVGADDYSPSDCDGDSDNDIVGDDDDDVGDEEVGQYEEDDIGNNSGGGVVLYLKEGSNDSDRGPTAGATAAVKSAQLAVVLPKAQKRNRSNNTVATGKTSTSSAGSTGVQEEKQTAAASSATTNTAAAATTTAAAATTTAAAAVVTRSPVKRKQKASPVAAAIDGLEGGISAEEHALVRMKLAAALGSKSAFAHSQLVRNSTERQKPKMTLRDLVAQSINNKQSKSSAAAGTTGTTGIGGQGAMGRSMRIPRLSPRFSPRGGGAATAAVASAAISASAAAASGRPRVHPSVAETTTAAAVTALEFPSPSKRPTPVVGLFSAKGAMGRSIKNIVVQARESAQRDNASAAAATAAAAGSAAAQRDMNTVLTNIHSMNRRIETQNDMIVALYANIQFLNHQLQQIHPELKTRAADFQIPPLKPSKNFSKNAAAHLPAEAATATNDPLKPLLLKQRTASSAADVLHHHHHSSSATSSAAAVHSPRRGSRVGLFGIQLHHETPAAAAVDSSTAAAGVAIVKRQHHHSASAPVPSQNSNNRSSGAILSAINATSKSAATTTAKGSTTTTTAQVAKPSALNSVAHAVQASLETVEETFSGAIDAVDHGIEYAVHNAANVFRSIGNSAIENESTAAATAATTDADVKLKLQQSFDGDSQQAATMQGDSRSPSQLSEFTLPNDINSSTAAVTAAAATDGVLSEIRSYSADSDGNSLTSQEMPMSLRAVQVTNRGNSNRPHLLDDTDVSITSL